MADGHTCGGWRRCQRPWRRDPRRLPRRWPPCPAGARLPSRAARTAPRWGRGAPHSPRDAAAAAFRGAGGGAVGMGTAAGAGGMPRIVARRAPSSLARFPTRPSGRPLVAGGQVGCRECLGVEFVAVWPAGAGMCSRMVPRARGRETSYYGAGVAPVSSSYLRAAGGWAHHQVKLSTARQVLVCPLFPRSTHACRPNWPAPATTQRAKQAPLQHHHPTLPPPLDRGTATTTVTPPLSADQAGVLPLPA